MTGTRGKAPSAKSLDEIGRQIQQDLQDVIDYLNDKVVPGVRHESTRALRTASRKLADLAEYMEKNTPRR